MTGLALAGLFCVVLALGVRTTGSRPAPIAAAMSVSVLFAVGLAEFGEALLGGWRDVGRYFDYAVSWSQTGEAFINGTQPTENTAKFLGYLYLTLGEYSFGGAFAFSRLVGIAATFLMASLLRGHVSSSQLLVLLLLPSSLIWTSIYGKDSLALFAIALVIASHGVRSRPVAFSCVAAGLAVLSIFRPELLPVPLVGWAVAWASQKPRERHLRFVLFCGAVLTLASASGVGPLAQAWSDAFEVAERTLRGGSAISFPGDPGLAGLVLRVALMPVRPLPISTSLVQLGALAEAFAVLIFLIRKARESSWRADAEVRTYLSYAAAYMPAVASLSNEGLVARQRLPITVLILLAAFALARNRPGRSLHQESTGSSVLGIQRQEA